MSSYNIFKFQPGFQKLSRYSVHVQRPVFRICIIGSGPAGLYTAQKLLKSIPLKDNPTKMNIEVDLIERLPAPYGLVRYGVAPDHPEVKNCIYKFEELFQHEQQTSNIEAPSHDPPRIEWIGGISLGQDVQLEDLCRHYDAVTLAIGAQQEKMLGVKGESIFKNIYPSMTWTGWVNGFPNLTNAIPTLNFSERMPSSPLVQSKAVIFGNGNVALDVARLLLMPVESLKHTDIKEEALITLSTSSIKHVNIVGRRGPGQVSFTTAELREIFKLASAHKYPIFTNRLDLIQNLPSTFIHGESRTLQSITKLFKNTSIQQLDDWNINIIKEYGCEKSLTFTFLVSPKEFHGNVENEMASGILCYKNEYIEDQRERQLHEQKVQKTAIETTLEASLFVKCIGYSIERIPSLSPTLQDPNTGQIMTDRNNLIAKFPEYENLFTSGWCRGGPSGQLANTIVCANDAAESILEYVSLKASSGNAEERQGRTWLLSRLKSQGTKYLLYKDWQKINEKEIELGRPLNKPREKLTELDSLGPFKHL